MKDIKPEYMEQARDWFIKNCLLCIKEAATGEVFVNDLNEYIKWRKQQIEAYERGENDHTFTFLQRAYFIQTGESVALLP